MPIEVKISSDEFINEVNNPLSIENNKPKEKDNDKISGQLGKTETALIKFGIDQAKTWAMQGIKAYTSFTGNSMLQQKLDNAVTAISMGATIGIAFATNIVVGMIAVGGYAAQMGLQQFQANVDAKIAERTQSFIMQGQGQRNISGGRYGA